MKNLKPMILCFILVIVTILTTFVVFRLQAQEKSQIRKEEPTLIQEDVMTEKQRKNSKLYKGHPKIENLISKEKDVQMIIGEPYPINKFGGVSLPSQETYLQDIICKTNTIVVAKVKNKNSQISEDKKSVFTDYELEIKDIIKNNSSLDLKSDSTITLTRSGGAVKINGHVITISDKSYKRLNLEKDYLFFLNHLNESDSFTTSDIEGVFEISENKLTRFSDTSILYQNPNEDLNSFTNFIHNATQKCF